MFPKTRQHVLLSNICLWVVGVWNWDIRNCGKGDITISLEGEQDCGNLSHTENQCRTGGWVSVGRHLDQVETRSEPEMPRSGNQSREDFTLQKDRIPRQPGRQQTRESSSSLRDGRRLLVTHIYASIFFSPLLRRYYRRRDRGVHWEGRRACHQASGELLARSLSKQACVLANRLRRSPTTRFRSEPIEPGSMVLSRNPRSWMATKGTAQIQMWGRVEAIPNDRRYEGSEEPSEVPGRSCILAISPASREPARLLPPRTMPASGHFCHVQ